MYWGSTQVRALLSISAILLSGCESNTIANYFSKLPAPANLQFGAQTSTMTGQSWTPYTNFNVGIQPFGSTSKSIVYLSNIGALPASVERIWVDGNYYSVENDCGNTIPANSVPCKVTITYVPNTIGATTGNLNVQYSNGNGISTGTILPLTGTGSNLAYLQFQQSSMTAPSDTVSANGTYTTSATFNVLYNGAALGAAGLKIDPAQGVMVSSPNETSYTIDANGTTCGNTISTNCVVKINFSPTLAGAHAAAFNISYFNGAEVLSIPATITGTGLTSAVLATLSGNAALFANAVVGAPTPVTQNIPVNFAGSVPATGVVITGPSDSSFTMSTDPTKSTCFSGSPSSSINGNCVLSVTFTPTAYQTYSSSIGISYSSNGQTRTPITIGISGTGVHPALLTPNTTTLAFGNDPAHEQAHQYFTFTNSGGVAPSGISTLTSTNTSDFTSNLGNCSSAGANGGTCTLDVYFTPRSASALSTNLSFTYFDGKVTQTVSLSATGTGTAPLVVLGATTIDFQNVMIGGPLPANQTKNLSIYGTTLGSLTVAPNLTSPFAFPGGGFPGGGTCTTSADPNSQNSCSFIVGVTSNTGFTDGQVETETFTVAGGAATQSFTTKMTLRNPPVLAFSAAPTYSTISVGNNESANFTVTNNSPYFATAFSSIGGVAAPFSITNDGCSGGVSPGGTCTISVKFSPTAAGTFNGTLNYAYSDQISVHTISSNFSAIASPNVTLSANPTTIDFGNVFVGDPVTPKTISLTYYGASNWTNSGAPTAPFTMTTGTCGNQGNCTLTISLDTSAQVNSANQNVSFTYAPALDAGTIALTFKANIQYRQATLALSPTNFANTLQGANTSQTLTLTNTGSGTASSLTVGQALTSGFSFTGGTCLTIGSLTAGQTCTLITKFAPTSVGNLSTSFNIGAVSAGSSTSVPTSFTLSGNGTQLIQAFAGAEQTCIIDELDNAVCWGRNSSGQLGQGNSNTLTTQPKQMSKISFGAGVQVKKLAVGDSHTCAILNTSAGNGKVSCWGSNGNGRLGMGNSTSTSAPIVNGTLQLVNLGTDSSNNAEVATDISAGFEHTCALLQSGKVKCWGGNGSGQLGIGSTQDIGSAAGQMGNALQAVSLNGTPVSISAGAGNTCAALSDGGSKCWGDNHFGQLGQGVSTEVIGSASGDMGSLQEIALGNGMKVSQINAAPGLAFTCALLKDGAVKCFGETDYTDGSTFWGVLGGCWARPYYNSAAVPCWSNSSLTQTTSLGYFTSDMGDDLPAVSLANTVSQISMGSAFVCTVQSDSNVRCWGANDHGQLGIGNNNNLGAGQSDMGSNLPAALSNSNGVAPVSVATGYYHACSVLNNNTVKCWGQGGENETGLLSFGIAGDTGTTAGTAAGALQVVYDGR